MSDKQKFLEDLRLVFLESCEDRLHTSLTHLEKIAHNDGDATENLMVVRRDLHSMKGMGGACGYPGITAVTHRAEEFLSNNNNLSADDISQLYKFFDCVQSLMDRETQPNADEIAEMVRKLPYHSNYNVEELAKDHKVVEALSIMPESVHQRLINNELRSLGFRVSSISSSLEAIRMIVHTKPDIIVISAIVDEISGIELTKILRVIDNTKSIPIILVTSFDKKSLAEENLPADITIARKGESFSEDISNCLIDLKII